MNISITDLAKFIETYFITGFVLLLILSFYDWGLSALQVRIRKLDELKKKLLYHPTLLIWVFKAENSIIRFLQLIRPKWVAENHDERRGELYKALHGGVFKTLLQLLFGAITT